MPSPEQKGGAEPSDLEPKKEQESKPYYLASQFGGERPAGRAYFQAQELIFNTPDCDLSVFRFQLSRIYHVAVIGIRPDEGLERRLRNILSRGESVSLSPEILRTLMSRRSQATRQGPWVERHYRPGTEIL